MQYNTIVEKDESGLQMILNAANKFEKGKYMYAITERHFSKNDILDIILFVREYKNKLDKEHYALARFALNFNKQYATDNNKCFTTAEKIFNRIRSTISGSKKIYKKFCKRNMKPIPPIVKEDNYASIFKRSTLLSAYRDGDLFDFMHYEDVVYELFDELEECFKKLIMCLALCHAVIWEEEQIRKSPERCLKIYHDCFNQIVDNTKYMIRLFRKNSSTTELDEIGEKMKSAKSLQKFICDGYHNYNTTSFNIHVVTKVLNDEQDATPVETLLWQQDFQMIKKARCVIAHFDELEPEGQKGKLYGPTVTAFMLWTGVGMSDSKRKMFVEEYFNKEYKGKYKTVKVGAVNSAITSIIKEDTDFNIKECNDKIEKIISKYMNNDRIFSNVI